MEGGCQQNDSLADGWSQSTTSPARALGPPRCCLDGAVGSDPGTQCDRSDANAAERLKQEGNAMFRRGQYIKARKWASPCRPRRSLLRLQLAARVSLSLALAAAVGISLDLSRDLQISRFLHWS